MAKQEKENEPKTEEKQANEPPKDDADLVVKEDVTTLAPAAAATGKKKFDLKAFLKTKKGKIVAAVVAFAVIVGVVFAVPASRYAVAGLVVKKDVTVELVDSETGKPVSAADVSLAGQTYKTDANGKTTFKNVAVGPWQVTSKKSYYEDGKTDTLVPILRNPDAVKFSVVATGRQVPVMVTNKITGKPLANVEIVAGDSAAKTTENGEASIVLPADKQTVSATFKVDGHNDLTADITVTEQADDKNKFAMVPAGKVYFLSKRTGKIDVMSSNLDGSEQTVVLAATGKESEYETKLFASPDWKYLALKARRENDTKLYLITTADNKLSMLDEGASFNPVGWSGSTFVYDVYRPTVKQWESKQRSIKSYNADSKKISTLDDTEGAGTGPGAWLNQLYSGDVYLSNDRVVFIKKWEDQNMTAELNSKKDQVVNVKLDGSDKKIAKEFNASWTNYIVPRQNKPGSIYLQVAYHTTPNEYYEYTDGQVSPTTAVDNNTFYNQGIHYIRSPQGKQTLWTERRDKQVIFVGDATGADGKEVLTEGDHLPLGWYGENYLLLTNENFNTIYVYPAQPQTGTKAQKITEFLNVTYVAY